MSDRGDYDLKNHSDKSKHFLGIRDENGNEKFPNVIEVSFGIERLLLAVLENGYREEIVEKSKQERKYLSINPLLCPFFAAVMPLSKQLNNKAYEIYLDLIKTAEISVAYEETGNIGNRYRRQDAIGTFFCITVDFETENDNSVTIRNRDTMEQKRIFVKDLKQELRRSFEQLKENFLS
jgi:glycyl-tRNA synthetase